MSDRRETEVGVTPLALTADAAALLEDVKSTIRTQPMLAEQLSAVDGAIHRFAGTSGLSHSGMAQGAYRDTAYQDRYADTPYRDTSEYKDTPSYRDEAR